MVGRAAARPGSTIRSESREVLPQPQREVLPLFFQLGEGDLAEALGVRVAQAGPPVERLEIELEAAGVLAVLEVPEEVDEAPGLRVVDRDHLRIVELRL